MRTDRVDARRRVLSRITVVAVVAGGTSVLSNPAANANSEVSIAGSHVAFLAEGRRFIVNDTACDGFRPYAKFHWERPSGKRSPTKMSFFFGNEKKGCEGPRLIDIGGTGSDVPVKDDLTVVYRACVAKPGKDPCSEKVVEFVSG